MNTYQLACGHWQSPTDNAHDIGGTLWCGRCNLLHVVIIGMSTGMRFGELRA